MGDSSKRHPRGPEQHEDGPMKFLNRRIAKWASKVIRNELAKSTELVDELGQPKINPVWMCTRNKQITRPYYYLGKNWALTLLSNGLPFFVNTDDHGIATWIILGGTWENFVDDVLCAYAQPGMTVLDIGANLGYYTIKLADRIGPQGHLHAFEPNPEHSERFRCSSIASVVLMDTLNVSLSDSKNSNATWVEAWRAPRGSSAGHPEQDHRIQSRQCARCSRQDCK